MASFEDDIDKFSKIAEDVPNVHVELETSFSNKISSTGTILGSVHLNTFNRFKEHLLENIDSGKYGKVSLQENIESEDKIYNIHGLNIGGESGTVSKLVINDNGIMIKVRKYYNLLNEYGMKTSLSLEQKIDEYNDLPDKPTLIRFKKRTSFVFNDMKLRLDFTIVNDTDCEIEAEFIGDLSRINTDNYKRNLLAFFSAMNDSLTYYTIDNVLGVMRSIHRIMDANIPTKLSIDSSMLAQARNLKMKDIVYGGMVGGEYQGKSYRMSATLKADGIRRWIYLSNGFMWLVMAPQEFSILGKVNTSDFENTIIEVEYIPVKNRLQDAPTERWWLCGFDCLVFNGQSIVNKSHFERLNVMNTVISKISVKNVVIQSKEFHFINTVSDFYKINEQLLKTSAKFKTDGIIYTPDQVPYKVDYGRKKAMMRCLVNEPEILKFKRAEDLGIDFKIVRSKGRLSLYCKGDILFTGSRIFPITDNILENTDKYLDPDIPNGSLCEMFWNSDDERLESHRVRTDRTYANNIDIAVDVWNDAHLPILPGTLTGNNGQGFIRYHNRVKAEIFENLAKTKGKTLVDLGSGKGGDGERWRAFDRIVAVEPCRESILEMKHRLENMGLLDRVMIVNCGAEDTDRIWDACLKWLGGAADCLSMMLSMSFLFIEKDGYKKLAKTINTCLKPTGTMGFLTIDGNAVRQLLLPDRKKINFSYISLKYIDDSDHLYIKLHDPDTGKVYLDQKEGLVDIEALSYELKYWNLSDYHSATRERMLCSRDKIITKLYFSGYFLPNLKRTSEMKVLMFSHGRVLQRYDMLKAVRKNMGSPDKIQETGKSLGDSGRSRAPYRSMTRNSGGEATSKSPDIKFPSLQKGESKDYKFATKTGEKVIKRHYTTGLGNCAFHSFLTCTDEEYRTLKKTDTKEEFAVILRKSLATWLEENPHMLIDVITIPGDRYYKSHEKLIECIARDGVFLYAENFSFLAKMTGYNIVLIANIEEHFSLTYRTMTPIQSERNWLIIFGNGGHYEACSFKDKFLLTEVEILSILN